MKTMPRPILWGMRLVTEAMLTLIRHWEDKHADHTDYRMRHLNAGLWQASQSLREIRAGQFRPMRRQEQWSLPESAAAGAGTPMSCCVPTADDMSTKRPS